MWWFVLNVLDFIFVLVVSLLSGSDDWRWGIGPHLRWRSLDDFDHGVSRDLDFWTALGERHSCTDDARCTDLFNAATCRCGILDKIRVHIFCFLLVWFLFEFTPDSLAVKLDVPMTEHGHEMDEHPSGRKVGDGVHVQQVWMVFRPVIDVPTWTSRYGLPSRYSSLPPPSVETVASSGMSLRAVRMSPTVRCV